MLNSSVVVFLNAPAFYAVFYICKTSFSLHVHQTVNGRLTTANHIERLRERKILRVFENRMLSRIFGPTRDDVMGGWRKLHD
jgi:hypothetical protein